MMQGEGRMDEIVTGWKACSGTAADAAAARHSDPAVGSHGMAGARAAVTTGAAQAARG